LFGRDRDIGLLLEFPHSYHFSIWREVVRGAPAKSADEMRVHELILKLAVDTEADLILMGTRGPAG
jgi:hypothetical protein